MVIKVTVRSFVYKLKGKTTEYLPNILHLAGSGLSIASGIPSATQNPAYGLNVVVGYILGREGLPSKNPEIISFLQTMIGL